MATLFDRTGYSFTDPDNTGLIKLLPNTAIQQLNAMPALVPEKWMRDDLITANNYGYYVNPVANSCNIIWAQANTLAGITNDLYGGDYSNNGGNPTTRRFAGIYSTLNLLVSANGEMVQFINHTNRISGVVPASANTEASLKPCLEPAMLVGRALTTLVYQIDDREDNAPMMGSLTSILIANTLSEYANAMVRHVYTVNTSISINVVNVSSNATTNSTSNLSYAVVVSIGDFIDKLYELLNTRRTHDENFYTKSNQLVNEAISLRRLGNVGATEANLTQTLVGTDKLNSRLSSNTFVTTPFNPDPVT